MNKKCETIGGQAVIEGVMMRSKNNVSIAVRDEEGNIQLSSTDIIQKENTFASLPFIRGFVNFCKMLVEGIDYINKSANMAFGANENEPGKLASFLGVVLGLFLAIGLFIFLPTWLVSFISDKITNNILLNLCEGVIRILIFTAYLLIISSFKDMKRFFMYHGAEHKTIACSEKGLKLTVDNAKTCSRLHPRCGTTFMFLLMFISILVYSLILWTDNLLLRTIFRVLLLPFIAGISYEVLKWAANKNNIFVNILKAPGFMLQKITTAEPTDDMLEVAIVAFQSAKLTSKQLSEWKDSETGINYYDYED